MGGKSEIYHNCAISNKLNLQNLDTLSESVDCFWELEAFVTRPKTDLPFYRKTNKRLWITWGHSRKDDGQSFSWFILERAQVPF